MTAIVNVKSFDKDDLVTFVECATEIENLRLKKKIKNKFSPCKTKAKKTREEIFEVSSVTEEEFLNVLHYNCTEKSFNMSQSIEDLLKYFDEDVNLDPKNVDADIKKHSQFPEIEEEKNSTEKVNNEEDVEFKSLNGSDYDCGNSQKTDCNLPLENFNKIQDHFKNMTIGCETKRQNIEKSRFKTKPISFPRNGKLQKPIPKIRHKLNEQNNHRTIFTPPRPKPRNPVLKCASKLFNKVDTEEDLSTLSVKEKISLFNELIHPYGNAKSKKNLNEQVVVPKTFKFGNELNLKNVLNEENVKSKLDVKENVHVSSLMVQLNTLKPNKNPIKNDETVTVYSVAQNDKTNSVEFKVDSIPTSSIKRKNNEIDPTLLIDIFAPPKKIRRAHMSKRFLQIYFSERLKKLYNKEFSCFKEESEKNVSKAKHNEEKIDVVKKKQETIPIKKRRISEIFLEIADGKIVPKNENEDSTSETEQTSTNLTNTFRNLTICVDNDTFDTNMANNDSEKMNITPKTFERAYTLTTLSPQSQIDALKISSPLADVTDFSKTLGIDSRTFISSEMTKLNITDGTPLTTNEHCAEHSSKSPRTEKLDKCKTNSDIRNQSAPNILTNIKRYSFESSTPKRNSNLMPIKSVSSTPKCAKTPHETIYFSPDTKFTFEKFLHTNNSCYDKRSYITTNGLQQSTKKFSNLWFATTNNCKIVISILHNTPARLRYFFDLFQKNAHPKRHLEFGIDSYKFSRIQGYENVFDTSKMWPKLPGYSHYWFSSENVTIPFDGEYMRPEKIRNLFLFLKNSMEGLDFEIKFGVDDLDFSSIISKNEGQYMSTADRYFSILNVSKNNVNTNHETSSGGQNLKNETYMKSENENEITGNRRHTSNALLENQTNLLSETNNIEYRLSVESPAWEEDDIFMQNDDEFLSHCRNPSISSVLDMKGFDDKILPETKHDMQWTQKLIREILDHRDQLERIKNDVAKIFPRKCENQDSHHETDSGRLSVSSKNFKNSGNSINTNTSTTKNNQDQIFPSKTVQSDQPDSMQYLKELHDTVTDIYILGQYNGFQHCSRSELLNFMCLLCKYADYCTSVCIDNCSNILNVLKMKNTKTQSIEINYNEN